MRKETEFVWRCHSCNGLQTEYVCTEDGPFLSLCCEYCLEDSAEAQLSKEDFAAWQAAISEVSSVSSAA